MPNYDSEDLTCERSREAISALVDGEDPGMDVRVLEAHVRRCAGCRSFRRLAEQTRRFGALAPAPEMPDLSRRVSKLAAIADRASAWSLARVALAVVAIEIMVLAIGDLLARDNTTGTAHDQRHVGAFAVSYAVALMVVVARPARARTVLPVAAVLAGALAVTAVIDLVSGATPLVGEMLHLPEVLSVALVWALASSTRRPRARAADLAPRNLRVVDSAEREAS